MKYESYDDYIDNPLTQEELNNIANEVNNIKEKVKASNHKELIFKLVLASIFFITCLMSIIFNIGLVYNIGLGFLSLFIISRILVINGYDKEINYLKNINDNAKIEVKVNGKYYDYLGRSAGYQLPGIEYRLGNNKEIDSYHYPECFDRLLKNIGDRELIVFEYSILTDKYKTTEFKELNS